MNTNFDAGSPREPGSTLTSTSAKQQPAKAASAVEPEAGIDEIAAANPQWEGWETDVLKKLDNGDNKISVAEINAAQRRKGTKVVSSVEIDATRREVGVAVKKRGAASVPISSLPARAQELAQYADRATGAPDGKTSDAEIEAFGKKLAKGAIKTDLSFICSQRLSMIKAAVARKTGEPMVTDVVVRRNGAFYDSYFPAFKILFDGSTHLAAASVGTRFSSDGRYLEASGRTNQFFRDKMLRPYGLDIGPEVYKGTFDEPGVPKKPAKGHFLANAMFNDARDRAASFVMSNMGPQGAVNSGKWAANVEVKIRDDIVQDDSRMALVAGPLFVDDQIRPLPNGEMKWIAGKGKDGKGIAGTRPEVEAELTRQGLPLELVAVPTHYFMAVLEQTPDRKYSVTCYVVANVDRLPSGPVRNVGGDPQAVIDELRKSGAVQMPLKQLEDLTGLRIFDGLPAEIRQAVETNPAVPYKPASDVELLSQIRSTPDMPS